MSTKGKIFRIAFILLSLTGAGLALELTRLYVKVRVDPSFESVCAVNEQLNCLTVAESRYSALLGIPVSIWGLGGFLGMAAAAALCFARERTPRESALLTILGLSIFSVFSSVVLFSIAKFVIHAYCPYCMAIYVINILLFIFAALIFMDEGFWVIRSALDSLIVNPLVYLNNAFSAPALSALVLGVVMSGFALFLGDIEPELPTGPEGLSVGLTADGHPWIGARRPLITIEEYTDYQCPHCRTAHANLRALLQKYDDRVRLVHRHLPLDHNCHPLVTRPFHPYSCKLSAYAVCAAEQGRFWETNDYLFSLSRKAPCPDPASAAGEVGLDPVLFAECLASDRPDKCIAEDIICCNRLGIFATPTYLCEGSTVTGALTEEELVELLDRHEKDEG